MKLSDENKKTIKDAMESRDWENVHGLYDKYIIERLKILDKEYLDDLNKNFEGATFWFA